jgi:type III secretion system OrgA/MxiK family protein
MNAENQRMMSILYAPAGYTHASRLPKMFRAGERQDDTLLNFWLLRQSKLCDLPDTWQPGDATLSRLLSHWQQIPAAAHLIGGYLLRSRLLKQSAVLMSDPRLLAFISLPLLHQVHIDHKHTGLDTASCGAAFILGQFPGLPAALRERLLLLFPAEMKLAKISAPKTPNNINLLRMALTYAHNYD